VGGEGDHRLAPRPRKTDAQISAETLAFQAEREKMAALRPPLDVDGAKRELISRGRTVYSRKVLGGRSDRFVVSGLGENVTPAELIAEAQRVIDGRPRP
jgi:hypothetical protein